MLDILNVAMPWILKYASVLGTAVFLIGGVFLKANSRSGPAKITLVDLNFAPQAAFGSMLLLCNAVSRHDFSQADSEYLPKAATMFGMLFVTSIIAIFVSRNIDDTVKAISKIDGENPTDGLTGGDLWKVRFDKSGKVFIQTLGVSISLVLSALSLWITIPFR